MEGAFSAFSQSDRLTVVVMVVGGQAEPVPEKRREPLQEEEKQL